MADKPRVAIFDLTSCDGCQVEIVNLEDHILDLVSQIDLVNFRIAKEVKEKGPYDVAIVEGSVSTEKEAEKIRRDGIELAKGLAGKSKPRIPMAVEKVMQLLLEQEGSKN